MKKATKETKARVFGFHRSMDTAGATIGPALALLFLFFYPGQYQTIFFLAFIPGAISVALIYFLKEKKQPVSTLQRGNFFSFFNYRKIATPEYKRLVSGLLLFALFNSSDIFLLLKTKEAIGDQTITIAGSNFNSDTITIAAYVFYNLIYALASYPLGALADRFGFKTVFTCGLILFAIVYAGFAFNPSIGTVFFLFFVYGIYAAATDGVVKAWITNIAHGSNTGTAIGFYTSCESVCTLLASIIAGGLWTKLGSFYTFILPAGIAVVVILYFSSLSRSKA